MNNNTSVPKTLFENLEAELASSNTVRTTLITALSSVISNTELDLMKMKSDDRESYMAIARELNSTLNSRDNSHINVVKMKLQHMKDESDTDISKSVVELMKLVKFTNGTPVGNYSDPNEVVEDLEQAFENSGLEIPETELLVNN